MEEGPEGSRAGLGYQRMSWFLEGRKRKDANCQEYIKDSIASLDFSRVFLGATPTAMTTAENAACNVTATENELFPFDLPSINSYRYDHC